MKPEHLLYLISVWVHIVSAMVWVGGSAFIALVAVPVMRRGDLKPLAPTLLRKLALRFRAVGWTALSLLVVTGTLNLKLRGYGWSSLWDGTLFDGAFGHALAVKLSLAGCILLLSAIHDFFLGPRAARVIEADPASPQAARHRRWASRFGRVVLLLGLGVVAAAVYLVRG